MEKWEGPNFGTMRTAAPTHNNQISNHPRRPPAQRSVSLRHSHPPGSSNRSVSSRANGRHQPQAESPSTSSPSSLRPLGRRTGSNESSAEKWFEKSNNEIRDNTAPLIDHEPPFFMRNSSSSETPPGAQAQNYLPHNDDRASSLDLRAGMRLGTEDSSTEEYRNVIDDLTVQNRKLKRKLRRYEKLHDAHLKDQKLFEVRFHGLPIDKKRELEETLRKFASSLDTTGANAFPSNGYASLLPMLKSKTASSQKSFRYGDSAYASMSMSASGQGSSAQSGYNGKQKPKMTPTQHMAARRQQINSYLHHIPEGLMPQENPTEMSESTKKKLVVRRMEQLFAGRDPATGDHQHSLQQQEVSHSAARADKSATEVYGERARVEGCREASILSRELEDPAEISNDAETQMPDAVAATMHSKNIEPTIPAKSSTKGTDDDQRPTRPLDLDPHRAQMPAENIRYMRHLGFSPESSKSPEEGHSWIYLNFLINMAQLHTINVTSDFVRNAVQECSNKLEVSNDGRKIRWRGNRSVTRTGSSAGASAYGRSDDNTLEGQSPRKRPKLAHNDSMRSDMTRGSQAGATSQRGQLENSRHMYTPLFFHRGSKDDSEDSSSEGDDDNRSSPLPAPLAGDSSKMTTSGIGTGSGVLAPSVRKKPKPKHDDGPIIFYNNARFCTDLSGDRDSVGTYNTPPYIPVSSVPIGKQASSIEDVFEKRGPLAQAFKLPEPMNLTDNPIPESMEVSFTPQPLLVSDLRRDEKPIELEVTGIGGVWHADNFAISVDSRHTRIDQTETFERSARMQRTSLPPSLAKILHGAEDKPKVRAAVHKQILGSSVQDLPPSELPPALSFMPDDDSMCDDGSDADEYTTEASGSPGDFPPAAAPQPVELPYAPAEDTDEEYEESEDDEDVESDGEVDFLAAAREIDPEAVRRREREYDAIMAERLAEEIPTGSSAATAGGGSGFVSPASGVHKQEYRRAIRASMQQVEDMKGVSNIGYDEMSDCSS
ncbi:hypothetical protein LTR37_000976 [Vermiconidia calcicola]|uniref:Uncharacterized protein n=1 Tax=Vermiconidia calcicola TaxID=1690605 RepID=A0ACC3NW54_9PEZI|nr:hypothetical protein LTR37_000976 [Vermiconidia calcicola]